MWQDYHRIHIAERFCIIRENSLVQLFAKAYDAFYPVYDDPQVMFLKE